MLINRHNPEKKETRYSIPRNIFENQLAKKQEEESLIQHRHDDAKKREYDKRFSLV